MLLRQAAHDQRDVGLDRGGRSTEPGETEHLQILQAAELELLGAEDQRRPDFGPIAELKPAGELTAPRELESSGHHADHGEPQAVQGDLPTQHRPVAAESPPPEPVAQNRHRLGADLLVPGLEEPAHGGLHAERLEPPGRNPRSRDQLGFAILRQGVGPGAERRRIVQGLDARAQIGEVPRAEGEGPASHRVVGQSRHRDEHYPRSVGVGQRAHHHPVHNRENRGSCPDPECEREDGREGEPWLPVQGPEGKAGILSQLIQTAGRSHGRSRGCWGLYLDASDLQNVGPRASPAQPGWGRMREKPAGLHSPAREHEPIAPCEVLAFALRIDPYFPLGRGLAISLQNSRHPRPGRRDPVGSRLSRSAVPAIIAGSGRPRS